MAKANLQQLLNEANTPTKPAAASKSSAKSAPVVTEDETTAKRLVHKQGEVNISAYFPSEVKAALRLVQAKTGNNVKQCLAEALTDYFRKHNVPVTIPNE